MQNSMIVVAAISNFNTTAYSDWSCIRFRWLYI